MYFSNVILLSILVFVGDNFLLAVSEDNRVVCQGVDVNFSDVVKDYRLLCLKEQGAITVQDLPANKTACFGKCVFAHEGFIDEKGIPHKDKIRNVVGSAYPEPVREIYIQGVGKCLDDFASKVDPTEDSCSSYKPVMDCLVQNYIAVCHN